MKDWNDHIKKELQKAGFAEHDYMDVFKFIISFKNYDDEMFEWKKQGMTTEEIADKKLALLTDEISSQKYKFFIDSIWKLTLSENFNKQEQIFSYNKLITDASGYINWITRQEMLAKRTHAADDYTIRRNKIIMDFLEDVIIICRRMLNGLHRFERRPDIYAESSLDVRATIESEYVNPLLDYGTWDASDMPFNKSEDATPAARLQHYGEIYKYYNERAERAKYHLSLVEKRNQQKAEAAKRYNMLPAYSGNLEDILKDIRIERDDMEKITPAILEQKRLLIYRNVFSVLMEKAYKFADVLEVIIPLYFQIKDFKYDAEMMLKFEQMMHYHPQRPVNPELEKKFSLIIDFYDELLDIVDSFKDGYTEWGRHFINEYGNKWFGKFLDVYNGKNPLNIEFDYSTYEICYYKNGWDEFFGVYSYKMSEP